MAQHPLQGGVSGFHRLLCHPLHRVDARVARDPDALGGNPLAQQVLARGLRRREVELGNRRGQPTVHLFGERLILVVGAQPRLHMPERDFVIECGKRGDEGGGRIALRQHDLGGRLAQYPVQPLQRAQRNLGQRLARGHNIEVYIGRQVEQAQHLVEHLAVLSCRDEAHGAGRGFSRSARTTGAILMASGRVPHTASTAIGRLMRFECTRFRTVSGVPLPRRRFAPPTPRNLRLT
jgi:hypothetical protein